MKHRMQLYNDRHAVLWESRTHTLYPRLRSSGPKAVEYPDDGRKEPGVRPPLPHSGGEAMVGLTGEMKLGQRTTRQSRVWRFEVRGKKRHDVIVYVSRRACSVGLMGADGTTKQKDVQWRGTR